MQQEDYIFLNLSALLSVCACVAVYIFQGDRLPRYTEQLPMNRPPNMNRALPLFIDYSLPYLVATSDASLGPDGSGGIAIRLDEYRAYGYEKCVYCCTAHVDNHYDIIHMEAIGLDKSLELLAERTHARGGYSQCVAFTDCFENVARPPRYIIDAWRLCAARCNGNVSILWLQKTDPLMKWVDIAANAARIMGDDEQAINDYIWMEFQFSDY